ncbi:sensor histidine kinase [Bifidobacterium sp. ESL0820]|uniref:sensor histidine kinase n=1 Tax=Bifidobacterium sp. ESL0820 TaxID=3448586 RepID=UPI00404320AF
MTFVAVFFCTLYETGMLTRLILVPSCANQTLYQVMKSASWGLPLFVVIIFLALVTLCLRRLYPMATLLVVSGLLVLTAAIYGSGCTYLTIPWLVSLYACAVESKSMASLAAGLSSSAILGLLSIAFSANWHRDVHFTDLLYPTGLTFALCLTVAFLSRSVRQSRMSEQALEEERSYALTLAHERDQAMHQSRVASQLHDSVGHDLTAIIALSEGLDHASGKPEIDEAISMINDLARQGLDDTRTAVKALQSETDPKNDPQPATGGRHSWDDIKPILDHARHVGISTALTETGRRPQDSEQADLAFTVTREAITNALRHGQEVNRIVVSWDHDSHGGINITIRDDGQLLNNDADDSGDNGTGLARLRGELRAHGGSFNSGPGPDGWTLQARIPSLAATAADNTGKEESA